MGPAGLSTKTLFITLIYNNILCTTEAETVHAGVHFEGRIVNIRPPKKRNDGIIGGR